MSTDCYHDILQNYSVHYVHHCRPIVTECKWYWYIFVLSMLCIECTYVFVLFCISSSISTIPWWQNPSSVYSPCRSGRHFPRRLSDLAKMRILRVEMFVCHISKSLSFTAMGSRFPTPDVEVFQKAQLPKMRMGFLTFECCRKSMSNPPRHFMIPFKWSCCKKSDWMMFFRCVILMYHSYYWNLLSSKFSLRNE